MSHRKRNVTIVLVVLVLAVIELAYQYHRPETACVLVCNQSTEPIEGLTITCGDGSTGVTRIRAGESAKLYLTGGGKQVMILNYRHKGSALQGFQVAGFDLTDMSRERSRLVINIRSNEFERYQEEDEPSWIRRAGASFVNWDCLTSSMLGCSVFSAGSYLSCAAFCAV